LRRLPSARWRIGSCSGFYLYVKPNTHRTRIVAELLHKPAIGAEQPNNAAQVVGAHQQGGVGVGLPPGQGDRFQGTQSKGSWF